jgi:uracil-DNA glycosylase
MSRAAQLEELHKRMRACRLCLVEGHDIIPGAVFSGSQGAHIMIIGQAPGVTEVEAGRPFNAGSGSRLFAWLAEAGFEESGFRQTHYMTAVTKCFPGKAVSGGGDRVPSRQEQELCRPYLEEEIRLVDPDLIIPVGRLAINLFFPASTSLTGIIGRELGKDGRSIIPLPHPSGASRWHQIDSNRVLIDDAVNHIRRKCIQLGVV